MWNSWKLLPLVAGRLLRKANSKKLNIIVWFWFCQLKMSSGNQFLVLVQQEKGDEDKNNLGLLIWLLAKN